MLQRGVRILSLCSKCPAEAFGKAARCGAEASNPGWHCKCPRDYFNNQDPKIPTLEVLVYAWPPPDSWSRGVGGLVSHCRSCDFWRRNFYPSEPQFPSKKKKYRGNVYFSSMSRVWTVLARHRAHRRCSAGVSSPSLPFEVPESRLQRAGGRGV